ncbi:uncharacterized protein MONOS_5514 [Monocercomonoides exilis]|uniref:uncharacterized protein n=1 Tax=Monocercomonoides exilis TaxID=2049356 RepID=UPI00355A49FF|nr:hypothetical protein MONOS_5514 [Monocercomonoides exilis]|eukprot:MONOS_5514.1-p1 / transcript=MONOS_5514.1 / gene=MONOS_5514 / organism=Monocercomonoides_exilis_PA203 / gene_product=unspecified product / transcript_product=unspecified product / location=Mono_scaffold00161:96994-98706(+) / protein_length=570 / sequence_SO=supercontig / SO=protein_coding / is_pseudo=false
MDCCIPPLPSTGGMNGIQQELFPCRCGRTCGCGAIHPAIPRLIDPACNPYQHETGVTSVPLLPSGLPPYFSDGSGPSCCPPEWRTLSPQERAIQAQQQHFKNFQPPPWRPVFESDPISDLVLAVIVRHVSQIAVFCVRFAALDKSRQKLEVTDCRECKTAGLPEVASYFMESGMNERASGVDTLNGARVAAKAHFGHEHEFAEALAATKGEVELHLSQTLGMLQKHMRFRQTEILQGVILFDRLWKTHWNCSSFVLLRWKMKTTFLVCVMLGHKMSSDSTFQNDLMAHILRIPLSTLNEMERTLIQMMGFNLNVHGDEYIQYEEWVGGGCLKEEIQKSLKNAFTHSFSPSPSVTHISSHHPSFTASASSTPSAFSTLSSSSVPAFPSLNSIQPSFSSSTSSANTSSCVPTPNTSSTFPGQQMTLSNSISSVSQQNMLFPTSNSSISSFAQDTVTSSASPSSMNVYHPNSSQLKAEKSNETSGKMDIEEEDSDIQNHSEGFSKVVFSEGNEVQSTAQAQGQQSFQNGTYPFGYPNAFANYNVSESNSLHRQQNSLFALAQSSISHSVMMAS